MKKLILSLLAVTIFIILAAKPVDHIYKSIKDIEIKKDTIYPDSNLYMIQYQLANPGTYLDYPLPSDIEYPTDQITGPGGQCSYRNNKQNGDIVSGSVVQTWFGQIVTIRVCRDDAGYMACSTTTKVDWLNYSIHSSCTAMQLVVMSP